MGIPDTAFSGGGTPQALGIPIRKPGARNWIVEHVLERNPYFLYLKQASATMQISFLSFSRSLSVMAAFET
jgi:hypothetical protein